MFPASGPLEVLSGIPLMGFSPLMLFDLGDFPGSYKLPGKYLLAFNSAIC